MTKFRYTTKDKIGRTVEGQMQATDKKHAIDILRKKGLLILKLEEAKSGGFLFSLSKLFDRTKVKVKIDELVMFSRQLATMTEAGITIVNSLDTLASQVENVAFSKVIRDISGAVNTGSSLSEAMEKHISVFSDYFVNMIKAGESSGMLDEVLTRVAEHMEKTGALQKKIKSAMIYPAVVSSMALAITLVMILKVVPVFEEMFSTFKGAHMPAATQFIIDLSNSMQKSFWLISSIIIVITVAIKLHVNTVNGRRWLDNLKLRMPIFGPLLKKVAISKFARTLSTLVKSGVPILGALEIVAKTSGNVVVEGAINRVKNSVREGESIASPMEKSGIFPPLVTRMVSVGEKSGELEKMLSKVADFYDDQVNTTVDGLTSLIEPLIIAFLGIVVGGIVICMFLPIFQLSSIMGF